MNPVPSWRDHLLEWLQQPDCRPMTKSELARHFAVRPEDRAGFRAELATLLRDGIIEPRKGGRYGPAGGKPDVARGVFESSPKGKLAVRIIIGGKAVPPDNDGMRRVMVPDAAAGTALPGDLVEIRLKRARSDLPEFRRRGTRIGPAPDTSPAWEARVTGIIEEGKRATTGIFRQQGKLKTIEVEDRRFPAHLVASEFSPGCHPADGDLVTVRVISWDASHRPPHARVTRVLGTPHAPGNDILALIHRFDLPTEFPPEVLAEAASIALPPARAKHDDRDDWRDRLVVTIDPFDARDFDDAIHVSRTGDGWLLAVHIADVAHYVKPGGAMDAEARIRGNSTYLVDRVLPMLPESLSNGICSLVPGEDRLTRLVEMHFNDHADLVSARMTSAIIRSARRFTYEEAFALLQRPPATLAGDPAALMLQEAWNLASRLRKRRFQHGSLDLDFPEIKVVLDASGRPIELRRVDHDISHQLIEECMLAANETVATTLRHAGMACIHRVHDDPDEAKLWEFREMARLHGFPTGDLQGRGALRKLLARIRGEPEEHALKLSLLKSLKRACYSAEPRGHYGLAKQNYLHFTSPIRRYADLVVHRVLGSWSGHIPRLRDPIPDPEGLAGIAEHISITERVSAEAETESRRIKELEYFANLLDSGENREFPAVATEARRAGLFIELVDLQIKGLVPVSAFPPGQWWFEPESRRWKPSRGRMELRAGSKITVRTLRVDRANKFLDFAIVP